MIKTTTNRFIPQIVILGRFIDQFCTLNFQVLSCIPCYVELSTHVNISHKNVVGIDEYILSAFLTCDLTKLKHYILKTHWFLCRIIFSLSSLFPHILCRGKDSYCKLCHCFGWGSRKNTIYLHQHLWEDTSWQRIFIIIIIRCMRDLECNLGFFLLGCISVGGGFI